MNHSLRLAIGGQRRAPASSFPHPTAAPGKPKGLPYTLVTLLSLIAGSSACFGFATLPAYDGINYGPGYDLGLQQTTNVNFSVFTWTHIGITGGRTTTINVGGENLSYAGLTNSVGNSITNPAGPSQGLRYHSNTNNSNSGNGIYPPGGTGAIFYSLLLKVNSLGTLATGDYIAALNNTSTKDQTSDPTTIPARLYLRKSTVDTTKFNVGITEGSGGSQSYLSSDFGVGLTHLVVVRYITNSVGGGASVWVDPSPSDLGAASAPSGNITNTTGTVVGAIQSLLIANVTATTPPFTVDEVRLGTTWASVTTPGTPGITTQPANTTTDYAQTANLSVVAAGASVGGALTYQWSKNNSPLTDVGNITGSSSATLTLSSVSQTDEGTYKVTVSNNYGSTDSSTATLTVNDPKVTSGPSPASQALPPGGTATISATAIGSPTLTYKWKKDGSDVTDGTSGGTIISGSTTATLTISGVQAGVNDGSYTLGVTNGNGRGVLSSAATVSVNNPAITSDPVSQTKNYNQSVSFTATVAGTHPAFTYAWKKNGSAVTLDANHIQTDAGTASTLAINNLTAADAANSPGYTVTVTDSVSGTATSAAATLTVNDPIITTPVANVVTNAGATAVLKVTAAGSGSVTYAWKTNGIALGNGGDISGATSAQLQIANVSAAHANTYTVEVSGAGPTVTSSGTLSVATITRQPTPASQIIVAGNRTVFSAAASLAGPGALTYQWVRNSGSPYTGQTSTAFRIDSTQASDADSGIRLRVYYTGSDFVLSSPVSLAVTLDNRLKPANLFVLRSGDGTRSLTNGAGLPASVYLDQFDKSGNYVNTVSVPDSGADAAVVIQNVASLPTSSGFGGTSLQRSADGRYLVFSAYNADLSYNASLSAANPATVPRCAGIVGPTNEYSLLKNTSTLAFNGNSYRAASFDGTNQFWGSGATASTGNAVNGVFYFGSTSPSGTATSTASSAGAANVRYAQFFNVNGQSRLYFDSAASPAGLYYIDGFPTAGGSTVNTVLSLSINDGGTGAPGAAGFAVSPDGTTIYVADGRGWSGTVASTTGGIQKWVNGGLSKVLRPDPNNSLGTMYLTVDFSANPVVIYAVTTAFNSTQDQNELVRVVDDGSASGVSTVLATTGANECWRGISFGPLPATPHFDAVSHLPDGNIHLSLTNCSANIPYTIDASSAIAPTAWSALFTNTTATGTFGYDDLTATNSAIRFYRARSAP